VKECLESKEEIKWRDFLKSLNTITIIAGGIYESKT